MRNRTWKYLEVFKEAKRLQEQKQEEICSRFIEYKRANAIRTGDSPGTISVLYNWMKNYFETRVCNYAYSDICMQCKREVYASGLNCKTCGIWLCTVCLISIEGVCVCRCCTESIMEVPFMDKIECSMEIKKYYVLLKRCAQTPTKDNIQQIMHQLRELETEQYTGATVEERIKKNLVKRIKTVLCNWYLFKAREERYFMLVEQLDYLNLLKEECKQNPLPIEKAIQDILQEIAQKPAEG
ncbi:hypothetical protein NEOKW01_0189 [Nematocida sp. AWRm80]|nr:hypothetical protein NEOKW01_0189 [Nematocida sp. AWRm80]